MNDLNSFVQAASHGGRVVINENTPEPTITVARQGFKGRCYACLNKLPLLEKLDAVKNYCKRVQAENNTALGVFINTLSRRYGLESGQAALDSMGGFQGSPLNQRKVAQLIAVAARFHGQGDAKPLARQVVFRTWDYKGIFHPGHSSVTIKNKMDADAHRHVHEHVSWLPRSYDEGKLSGMLKSTKGNSHSTYQNDKIIEMSDRTAHKLNAGEAAREQWSRMGKDASPSLIAEAKYRPRTEQKRTTQGSWGTSARKVYLPMIGHNKDVAASDRNAKFVLFGLNEKAILRDARHVKDEAHEGHIGYTMCSTKENCASMALRMLLAGGAENFVPFSASWITEDPNKAHAYAQRLQSRIDNLNRQVADIRKHYDKMLLQPMVKTEWDAFLHQGDMGELKKEIDQLNQPLNEQSTSEDRAKQPPALKNLYAKQASCIRALTAGRAGALAKAIREGTPTNTDDATALTRKAAGLVEALHHYNESNPQGAEQLSLAAHAMIKCIEDLMGLAIE
ncbi:type III secretion system effector BopA family protein [Aeromonas salmonicida]|uniref:type III secretion system effector BopA family protein n=1 Tax=Aeromonas salmonicida TaxID=645 RepID=UPI00232BAD88|nr:type III secretion system effector BopA family protein [Aeromonas salmonicida]WCH23626.1 hypothetical protein ONZ54_04455 [Aeromonas salmonicida]